MFSPFGLGTLLQWSLDWHSAAPGTLSLITYPSTKAFLTGLGKVRLVPKSDAPPLHTQELAIRIIAEDWLDRHIPTRDPDRLAGRLWERLYPKPQPYFADNSDNTMAMSLEVNQAGSSAIIKAETGGVDRAFLEWSR